MADSRAIDTSVFSNRDNKRFDMRDGQKLPPRHTMTSAYRQDVRGSLFI